MASKTLLEAEELRTSINTLARFLAHEQIHSARELSDYFNSLPPVQYDASNSASSEPADVVVLCASAILSVAEAVLEWSKQSARLDNGFIGATGGPAKRVLVLCGGIGHSTTFIYEAIKASSKYCKIYGAIHSKPEAEVLQVIAEQFYGLDVGNHSLRKETDAPAQQNLTILVENRSTNCGANALETRKLLESHGVYNPRSLIIAQDPTMSRRTVASFERVYADRLEQRPCILSWPTFVPEMSTDTKRVEECPEKAARDLLMYEPRLQASREKSGLWATNRFLDLIVGEIPRLRDNEEGYGPRGSGFIVHVDIPDEVEASWSTVRAGCDAASQLSRGVAPI